MLTAAGILFICPRFSVLRLDPSALASFHIQVHLDDKVVVDKVQPKVKKLKDLEVVLEKCENTSKLQLKIRF